MKLNEWKLCRLHWMKCQYKVSVKLSLWWGEGKSVNQSAREEDEKHCSVKGEEGDVDEEEGSAFL